jgi:hypothetical protein
MKKGGAMRLFKLLALLAAVTVVAVVATPAASAGSRAESERNFVSVLLPVGGGPSHGFGLLLFRQPRDAVQVAFLDVWVFGLAPNHSYYLERATDPPNSVDGVCTGTNWARLDRVDGGQAITTNRWGFAHARLFRNLGALQAGTRFDIYFQLVDAATAVRTVVLQSPCHQFTVLP